MKKIKNNKIFQIKFLLSNNKSKVIKPYLYHLGNNVHWTSIYFPSEPYLVYIGDNVQITAGVKFITHDVIQTMFKRAGMKYNTECQYFMDRIIIGNNVMIGANSLILYGVRIGDNSVIAAGSVVVNDVESGSIVGGNPAKKIGLVSELNEKRLLITKNRVTNHDDIDIIYKYFWNENENL